MYSYKIVMKWIQMPANLSHLNVDLMSLMTHQHE